MILQPFPGYCIAVPVKIEERKTESGIIVAAGEKKRGRLEETQRGTVKAVCYAPEDLERLRGESDMIEIANEVIYGEFAGIDADIEGQRYRILEIKDVRAKIIR